MSDGGDLPLDELLDLIRDCDFETIASRRAPDLQCRELVSIPNEIFLYTHWTELWLGGNKLSSLPAQISCLTGLTRLDVESNPMEELPPEITALTNLKKLYIQNGEGQIIIKRAPRGISNLPCWDNTVYGWGGISFADALRKLELYDAENRPAVKTPAKNTLAVGSRVGVARGPVEAPEDAVVRKLEEAKRAEEGQQGLEAEKETHYIQTSSTFHPEQSKTDYKPFAKGDVFPLHISSTEEADTFKVSSADGDFCIDKTQAKLLGQGSCGNASPKDQQKRRDRLAEKEEDIPHEDPSEEPADPVDILNEQEPNVTEAEVNACLSGGLCGLCFSNYSNPCYLPCQHIFCSDCIKKAIIASKEAPPFRCPFCAEPVYVDEDTVGGLKAYDYDAACLGGLNAGLKDGADNADAPALRCKGKTRGVRCTEDATHYCVKCGEEGTFCEKHGDLHMDAYDESHIIKPIELGTLPTAKKTENCLIHASAIKFFCPSCPESPLKCAECALEDRKHLDEHRRLGDQRFDIHAAITTKIRELRTAEGRLAPNIESVEEKIQKVSTNYQQRTTELDNFIKILEAQVDRFKAESRKELDALNRSILEPLEVSKEKLECEMRRIRTAKQTLRKVLEKPEGERSLIQMGNALRFANQVLYSKYNTPTEIAPFSIVSRDQRFILDELKKLNETFMFGLSTTEIEAEGSVTEEVETETEALHSITASPESIQELPNITADSSTGDARIECPWAVCVHPQNGNIYVTDEDSQKVHIFSDDLSHVSSHHTGLIIPKALHGPRGIAVSNDGLIAVADCEGHSVKLFTDQLTLVKTIGGKKGKEDGQFIRPYSVAFDSVGSLYVADSGNQRVQKFDKKGAFVSVIGGASESGGSINSLVNGVCVNEEDKLLVLCAGSDRVCVFSKDGVFEDEVKLDVRTSVEAWSHLFRASPGVFGVCENKTGAIVFYNYQGEVQHRILMDGCLGACFGLDGTFYATSLSQKSVSAFSANPQ